MSILLDLPFAKLYIFVNRLFANNKDLSSQLKYIIVITNETSQPYKFTIHSNIVHYLFVKSKQVTRSILVSKIYRIVTSVNIVYTIITIVKLITN